MTKYGKASLLLVLTLLLTALMLFWTNIGESATAEIEYTGTGYYMTEQAGRDILEGWRSDRAAKEIYESALDDLYGEWQMFKGDMAAQIATIEESLTVERTANKAALRQARSPGFGVFAGAGYTTDGKVQSVVGVGLVWRVW